MTANELKDADAAFWKGVLTPQLRVLLEAGKYPDPDQLGRKISHDLLEDFSIFGPAPRPRPGRTAGGGSGGGGSGGQTGPGETNQQGEPWPSFLSDDFSPIEYSISVAPDRLVVRFAFEPVSDLSGTDADPCNTITTSKWLDKAVEKYGYDLEWYHVLRRHLMVESAGASAPASRRVTQQVFAFDMEGAAPRLKIYMMPDARVRQGRAGAGAGAGASEAPPPRRDDLVAGALEATGLGRPWALVRAYLAGLGGGRAGHVEALGWDAWCGPRGRGPAGGGGGGGVGGGGGAARQKAYVRFRAAGLEDVLAHLDLGGRLAGPRVREIQEAAREMWGAFLGRGRPGGKGAGAGEGDGDGDGDGDGEAGGRGVLRFRSIEDLADRTAGALLAYEMRLGMDEPCSVKFYYPVRYHFPSDRALAQRIDDFLVDKMGRQQGWYLGMMEKYCSHRDLGARPGIQTFVGGTVRRGVWDLTVYIGPEAYAVERNHI